MTQIQQSQGPGDLLAGPWEDEDKAGEEPFPWPHDDGGDGGGA